MASTDPIPNNAQVAGPHRSTVSTILRAVELGLFTMAEADVMIDRVRTHLTALPATPPDLPSLARPPLTVTAELVPLGAVVITVRGEVDLATGPLMHDALFAHLRQSSAPLVIDLTDVGFFAAAGLTVLVAARQAAALTGNTLCVVAPQRLVLRPLTITGLDRELDIHPDLAQALLRLSD
ncbi:STAS domain-containing protein [Actinophytocola sediminis]